MEVLSARMAPAFKGGDSWKYKRAYDINKIARQPNVKVEHTADKTVNFVGASVLGTNHTKPYSGEVTAQDGDCRLPVIPRSLGRMNTEGTSVASGHVRNLESSDQPEASHDGLSDDQGTSQDGQPDESDTCCDARPEETPATEALQKWPVIQIVEPPSWLPEGWTAVLRTRESGSKDKYYVDPISQRRFRSKTEVNYFLQTGKSYRYKRNLALLTKPLKEDPVSLSNTTMRTLSDLPDNRESVQTSSFMNPPLVCGGDWRGIGGAVPARSGREPDKRFKIIPAQAESTTPKSCSKPVSKSKIKVYFEEPIRSVPAIASKRFIIQNGIGPKSFQVLSTENRGKLILKLKRKESEIDEVQRNGKKQRPFEVIGPTSASQGNSKSEDKRHHLAVEHKLEKTSTVPHLFVPSTHVSRRPMSKAPPWQPLSTLQVNYGNQSFLNTSNGQGLVNRTSGCATFPESAGAKPSSKRVSPAEQLQSVGRKLCQQAVGVLSSDQGSCNPLQQISRGLHAALGHVDCGLTVGPSAMLRKSSAIYSMNINQTRGHWDNCQPRSCRSLCQE